MKVCHVTEASHPRFGGLYTATRGLAHALSEHEHVESVLHAGRSGEPCADADLCHAHGMWARSAFASLAWRMRHRRPLIVAPHGMLDPWALEQSALAKRLALATYEGLRLRTATCLHALCEAELESIRGLDRRLQAFVVPNGVDLPDLDEVHAGRRAFAAGGNPKTLLYLGRIHPKKGIDLAIEALASAFGADPRLRGEWKLEVCGAGDFDEVAHLRRLASDAGVADSVSFPGSVTGDQKARRLTQATAFILASRSEGLPMAVLEAWAYGLPSVISEACNLSVPARAGAALLTDASASSLAQRLGELMHMGDHDRVAMGAAGRAYVERVHPWPKVASRMTSIYRWALDGGTAPDPV